jgi:predicted XRE-type DNA-binding protein
MFTTVENVWEDMAKTPAEAASLKIRAQLMIALRSMINERGWNQHEAAKMLGVTQPRISALVRGKVRDFSIDALMGFLAAMGWSIEVHYTDEHLQATTKAA